MVVWCQINGPFSKKCWIDEQASTTANLFDQLIVGQFSLYDINIFVIITVNIEHFELGADRRSAK